MRPLAPTLLVTLPPDAVPPVILNTEQDLKLSLRTRGVHSNMRTTHYVSLTFNPLHIEAKLNQASKTEWELGQRLDGLSPHTALITRAFRKRYSNKSNFNQFNHFRNETGRKKQNKQMNKTCTKMFAL